MAPPMNEYTADRGFLVTRLVHTGVVILSYLKRAEIYFCTLRSCVLCYCRHLWQSHVEIEDYSVMFFNHTAVFEVSYCSTSIKGGGHTYVCTCFLMCECLMSPHTSPHMSPTLNESSAIQRFECSDAIEIRDGILFDFYTGLPQLE